MKRSILNRSSLPCIVIRSRIVTVILMAMTFGARDSNGQSEQQFEGLIMSDPSIPSFVASTNLKGHYDTEKQLKPMWTLKKLSLESRLKQSHSTDTRLRNRVAEAESQLEHWRKMIEDGMLHTQSKSSAFPLSRAAAEQLLIAAQLELQKVTWDLASEEALLKAAADARDDTNSATAEHYEKRLANLESKGMEEDVMAAKKELEQVEGLEKKGAISASDAGKARLSVSKAMNALAMQQMRGQLVEAQQIVAKDARSAEIKAQVQKLTARKEQIEKYIGDLFKAMGDLSSREQLLSRADRSEKTIATLTKMQDELQVKMDEIEGLVEVLNSVNFEVKKE